jgi:hypothetical protein
MGNTLSLVYNKLKYQVDKELRDPEADAYAKQQALQAEQDKAVADRKASAAAKASVDAKEAQEKKLEDEEKARKSKFSPVSHTSAKVAQNIFAVFSSLLLILLGLYAGSLSANKDIGYNIPFRIMSFIYGAILFPVIYIRMFIDMYRGIKRPYYGFLPIWKYEPDGWVERIFWGPFSFVDDGGIGTAEQEVKDLYISAAGATATVIGALGSLRKLATPVPPPAPVAAPVAAPTPVPVAMATPVPVAAPMPVPVART